MVILPTYYDWKIKLESWGYPDAEKLAIILKELNFCPCAYDTPFELARDLRKSVEEFRVTGFSVPQEIIDFFKWILDQFKKFVTDNIASISLMVGGSIATLLLPKWYKMIGIIPIFAGIYLMLKRYGVV